MNRHTRTIQNFFYGQYFSDGARISFGILLPALLFAQFNHLQTGLTISLGALCVSGADTPGPVIHKRNGMLICSAFILVVAIITGFARMSHITMGIEIVVLAFFFSMFTVYGNRAASIGTSSLLIMILMMEQVLRPSEILGYSATIFAGSIWYTALSLAFFSFRPYRAAQQALGENIMDVSKFLRIKTDFYRQGVDIDENYKKAVSQQIHVSQNQDAVRELLFKSRLKVKESTNASRILILTFVDLVDMFEEIMATHYDYSAIHQKFEATGILNEIAKVLGDIADELDEIGFAIHNNARKKQVRDLNPELEQLKLKIDEIGAAKEISNLVLKKILINLRNLNLRMTNIVTYNNSEASDLPDDRENMEYSRFVTHQEYSPSIYLNNLSLSSAIFKHSLRVALVCLIGFIAAKLISTGHHSYWILLTIIVILKPGFSVTKQRNYQRLIGTISGGILGILLLYFVKDTTARFIILMVLMVGTYSFLRINYIVSVILMTPYILILFELLNVGNIVEERILDTGIGSLIAFIASYLIFPIWEFDNIKQSLQDVLIANLNYLAKVAESLSGKMVPLTIYKLARKDVYVYSANVSAAFERMTTEPKRKQKHIKEIHKFVVLNHILNSYIANIASGLIHKSKPTVHTENLKMVKRSINILTDTARKIDTNTVIAPKIVTALPTTGNVNMQEPTLEEHLLKEQLEFIAKVSTDIAKITDSILQ